MSYIGDRLVRAANFTYGAIQPSAWILTFGLFIFPSDSIAIAQEPGDDHYAISMASMKRLVTLLGKETPVALIRFETGSLEGMMIVDGKPQKVRIAESGPFSSKGQMWLGIKGVFSVETVLRGKPPALGRVDETIFLESARLEWNEKYRRVQPLLPPTIIRNAAPIVCLAVWPKPTSQVLDATFLGPLSKLDAEQITEVAGLLKHQPFSELTAENTVKLLNSPNPWQVYLAVARLDDIKALTPKHFGLAMKSLPAKNTAAVTGDLFRWVLSSGGGKTEMAKVLWEFFGKLPPEKEVLFVKTFSANWRLHPSNTSTEVNLPDLQKAALEYRATIMNDPVRRGVVRELDALIDLRPKQK